MPIISLQVFAVSVFCFFLYLSKMFVKFMLVFGVLWWHFGSISLKVNRDLFRLFKTVTFRGCSVSVKCEVQSETVYDFISYHIGLL